MQLPQDLFARDDLESEWWYYHGHLSSGPRVFGFHLAFFRRRTDLLHIGQIIPVRFASDQVRFAHFAVTDISGKQFYYGQRRSLIGDAGGAADRYEVWIGDWFAKASGEGHRLNAHVRGVGLDLTLRPLKPAVDHQRGSAAVEVGAHEHYVTYSRMEARGSLVLDGKEHAVSGQAWMDRELGAFSFNEHLHGWDWFAIQLDDGRELLIFQMRDQYHQPTEASSVLFIDSAGGVERFGVEGLRITLISSYTSPSTSNTYPVGWQVEVAGIDAELRIEPFLDCHELDTRGSTNVFYWEGPAAVAGTLRGQPVKGRCYVELTGYDRNKGRLGLFDFAANNLSFLGYLTNEVRLRVLGPGVRVASTSTGQPQGAQGRIEHELDGIGR